MRTVQRILITAGNVSGLILAYVATRSHNWFDLAFGALLVLNSELALIAFNLEEK